MWPASTELTSFLAFCGHWRKSQGRCATTRNWAARSDWITRRQPATSVCSSKCTYSSESKFGPGTGSIRGRCGRGKHSRPIGRSGNQGSRFGRDQRLARPQAAGQHRWRPVQAGGLPLRWHRDPATWKSSLGNASINFVGTVALQRAVRHRGLHGAGAPSAADHDLAGVHPGCRLWADRECAGLECA